MFSIIMPAYNEEKNVGKALESILAQTFKEIEVVVVNDGSVDRTQQIVENFIEKDHRIKLLNPGKVGKNAAYNLASKVISGDWVYFMGADDQLPENAFELWNKAIIENNYDPQKLIALQGLMKVVSESPKYNGLILPKNRNRLNFSGPNTLMSKAMQKFILPLPENYPNEDGWWGLCIDYFAEIRKPVLDIVVYYNVHEGNSISRNSSYEVFSEKYHKRFIVRETFLERMGKALKPCAREKIQSELDCEKLRIAGKGIRILFHPNVSLIMRIRLFMFSNRFLYGIKKKFDRFFLGH